MAVLDFLNLQTRCRIHKLLTQIFLDLLNFKAPYFLKILESKKKAYSIALSHIYRESVQTEVPPSYIFNTKKVLVL